MEVCVCVCLNHMLQSFNCEKLYELKLFSFVFFFLFFFCMHTHTYTLLSFTHSLTHSIYSIRFNLCIHTWDDGQNEIEVMGSGSSQAHAIYLHLNVYIYLLYIIYTHIQTSGILSLIARVLLSHMSGRRITICLHAYISIPLLSLCVCVCVCTNTQIFMQITSHLDINKHTHTYIYYIYKYQRFTSPFICLTV